MEQKTELMAFRLPVDLAHAIRARAVSGATITDVVIRMLRGAPVGFAAQVAERSSDTDHSDTETQLMTPVLDVVGPQPASGRGKIAIETWPSGRKPILKPGAGK